MSIMIIPVSPVNRGWLHNASHRVSSIPCSSKPKAKLSLVSLDVGSVLDSADVFAIDLAPSPLSSKSVKKVSFDIVVREDETYGEEEYDRSAVSVVSSYFQLMSAHREVQNFKNFEMLFGKDKCQCETKQLRKPLKKTQTKDGRQNIDFFGATSFTLCLGPVECRFAKSKYEREHGGTTLDADTIEPLALGMGYSSHTDLTVFDGSFAQRRQSILEKVESDRVGV